MILRPFFSYYGSKHRMAGRYPQPVTGTIIEPFAGSAGYALWHHRSRVILLDANPIVAGVWSFLINAREEEVLRIPLLAPDEDVEDLGGVAVEARHLVGFWLRRAAAHPARRPSAWMRQAARVHDGRRDSCFWGEDVRAVIAGQQKFIRHWSVRCASYSDAPDLTADWFVDPPYQGRPGQQYRRWGSNHLDYDSLGRWCVARRGQVIVCEAEGADWLPFGHLHTGTGTQGTHRTGITHEAMWHQQAVG